MMTYVTGVGGEIDLRGSSIDPAWGKDRGIFG